MSVLLWSSGFDVGPALWIFRAPEPQDLRFPSIEMHRGFAFGAIGLCLDFPPCFQQRELSAAPDTQTPLFSRTSSAISLESASTASRTM
jgi:hypothetical protein